MHTTIFVLNAELGASGLGSQYLRAVLVKSLSYPDRQFFTFLYSGCTQAFKLLIIRINGSTLSMSMVMPTLMRMLVLMFIRALQAYYLRTVHYTGNQYFSVVLVKYPDVPASCHRNCIALYLGFID
jgi:hypothetical protein